jgi:hypothetical protein
LRGRAKALVAVAGTGMIVGPATVSKWVVHQELQRVERQPPA